MDDNVSFVKTEYGKAGVRILHVRRQDGHHHDIRELEVSTSLQLNSRNDYIKGDNSLVIPTDTQKNNVYILARKHGISVVEKFGIVLCNFYLERYDWVNSVKVHIENVAWKRIQKNDKSHGHAFLHQPDCKRFCEIMQDRHGAPVVTSGLKEMKVLKTTNSGFTDFNVDENTSLKPTTDRIFSTVVEASWTYRTIQGLDFDDAWNTVKETVLDAFAGPPETGTYSECVQKTLYDAEKDVLRKVPQIENIYMKLPNKHYYNFDFSKLSRLGFVPGSENTIFVATEKPSGMIEGELKRKLSSKL